jgi:hypothetical protein
MYTIRILLLLDVVKILLITWRERIIGGMETSVFLVLQVLDSRQLYKMYTAPCILAADSREFFDTINLRTL